MSNSDPVTGQAGWYDVRVRIYPAEQAGVWPEFEVMKSFSGMRKAPTRWLAYVAGKRIER
jgi:hypothetical protein